MIATTSISFQLLIGAIASIVIMSTTWIVCIRIQKAAWVDVVWAYSIGLLATLYFLLGIENPSVEMGWVLTLIWGVRLGTHLYKRVAKEEEDGRYQALRKKWGGIRSKMMFGFFMIQAAAAFVFSLPALFAIQYNDATFGWNEIVALAVALIAIGGEWLSDSQLKSFKKKSTDSLAVCNIGLWRYSRHPNYFFEWIYWFAYPILLIHTSAFVPMLLAPLIMLLLVTRVTGIPPTEAQAIRKRGDRYRDYQKTTSAFFPWFPKESSRVGAITELQKSNINSTTTKPTPSS